MVPASHLPPGPGGVTITTRGTPATMAGIVVMRETEGKAPLPRGT